MGLSTEYFIILILLLVMYPLLRYAAVGVWEGVRELVKTPRDEEWTNSPSLDASQLTNRIQQVREKMPTRESRNQFKEFKRSVLVESKRQEMAKRAFFQPPPPAPATEPEDDKHSFLLLA